MGNYSFEKKELTAGQEFSFEKEVPQQQIKQVTLGLGWDPAIEGKEIDLDANATLLRADGSVADMVFFNHQKSECGSIYSTGDDLTGQNSVDGDDEQIVVDLEKVPANIQSIVFSVTSYSGQPFSEVKRSYTRIVDTTDRKNVELANIELKGASTGIISSKLVRENNSWKFVAINKEITAKTVQDVNNALNLIAV
jgi:tellurium resistance protein TerZ|nr:MAG TPA: TerD-like protein [Caudoviricetes sp.]